MNFSIFFLFLIFYLPVPAKSEYFYQDCFPDDGNYTTNSTYLSNLNQLFSDLRSNSTATGFAAGTVGTVPDLVTGIAMCRGDLNASACSSCITRTMVNYSCLTRIFHLLLLFSSCLTFFFFWIFGLPKKEKKKSSVHY
jgi:Salt stress response/antifungal